MNKRLCVILTVVFIFTFTCSVMAEEPSVGSKIVDLFLVRPISLVGATVSTGAYLVMSVPLAIMGGAETASTIMVDAPWRFTNQRYLGDFSHYKDNNSIAGCGPCKYGSRE
ncbi:MAG: hypothetical protein OS130_01680 [Thermodesulfobacteriota bacterium]|nr:MAG: hypothetical protein OS130_01680 [Thermodesulfobacteriota bacterium]